MSVTGLYVQDEPEFLRSFERKRERETDGEDAQNSVNERGWSSLFQSLFSAVHSLPLACLTLLNLWKWNSCALAEILRQCHITYQNVQHLYIVQLWAEGEMFGWDVACGGSIEQWPPWLWLDPLCQLYSGPSVTPAGPGWVFYQDLPSLKIHERSFIHTTAYSLGSVRSFNVFERHLSFSPKPAFILSKILSNM